MSTRASPPPSGAPRVLVLNHRWDAHPSLFGGACMPCRRAAIPFALDEDGTLPSCTGRSAPSGSPAPRVGRPPPEHAHRAERVPAARPALALVHLEMSLTLVHVLERPAAVWQPVALDGLDGFGHPSVTDVGFAQVLEHPEDVVVVPMRERELEPPRIDDVAGRLPPEEPTLEQVLVAPFSRLQDSGRSATSPLMLEQPFEDVDRRLERRHRCAVLHLAVPAAVWQLLPEEPLDQRRHVDPEVGPGRDDIAVDARFALALEPAVVR